MAIFSCRLQKVTLDGYRHVQLMQIDTYRRYSPAIGWELVNLAFLQCWNLTRIESHPTKIQ